MAAKEPFTGLTRVNLENLVQGYEDKIIAGKYTTPLPPSTVSSTNAPSGQKPAEKSDSSTNAPSLNESACPAQASGARAAIRHRCSAHPRQVRRLNIVALPRQQRHHPLLAPAAMHRAVNQQESCQSRA